MKKCIVLILALLIILPLILTANAAEEKQALTKREAQELVAEAFNYNYVVRCDIKNYCKVNGHIILRHEDLSDIKFDDSWRGDSEVWYSEVNESKLLGGSYEAMKEYANNIYTPEIASYAYKYAFCFKPTKEAPYIRYPLFYRHSDGKLYANPGVTQHAILVYVVSTNKDNRYIYEKLADIDNLDVELISSDSSSAIAKVGAVIGNNEMNRDVDYLECKFVNTDSGWRIAECEFSNWMMYDRGASSPDTGDDSMNSILFFTALSVTALISAAVLMKRRYSF
jgi:hypothetical protein